MSPTRVKRKSTSEDPPAAVRGSDRVLLALAVLGGLAGLWALFLWRELLRWRAGAAPFCGFGGGDDCAALWDGAFAGAVHDLTGLPLAAWGVVWGAAAAILPLWAWADPAGRRAGALRSAARLTALAGAAGVAVLLLASAAEGMFCTSCALTYLLTVLYAAVALRGPREPLLAGAAPAAATTAGLCLLLLYPGLRTPKAGGTERAVADAIAEAASRDGALPSVEAFVESLPRELRQGLSDSLAVYSRAAVETSEEPRAVVLGSRSAPVRITEFADVLCGHCADLHRTLATLAASLPPSSFGLDARQFPLDGNCNPHLPPRGPASASVRCLAARVQICFEGSPHAFELAGALFENRRELTPELVYRLTGRFVERAELERCVGSAETGARLEADIAYAWRYRPRGTPLVLVNGRQGTPFGAFLFAMVLASGAADHPAFAALPPPSPALAGK